MSSAGMVLGLGFLDEDMSSVTVLSVGGVGRKLVYCEFRTGVGTFA